MCSRTAKSNLVKVTSTRVAEQTQIQMRACAVADIRTYVYVFVYVHVDSVTDRQSEQFGFQLNLWLVNTRGVPEWVVVGWKTGRSSL